MGSSEWLFGFVCGGLGGAAGQIVTNPIDIVKIKLQLQKGSRGSGLRQGGGSVVGGWRMLTDHVKATGAKGLFRGVSVAAGHQFVYSGVRLQAYEVWVKGESKQSALLCGVTPPPPHFLPPPPHTPHCPHRY